MVRASASRTGSVEATSSTPGSASPTTRSARPTPVTTRGVVGEQHVDQADRGRPEQQRPGAAPQGAALTVSPAAGSRHSSAATTTAGVTTSRLVSRTTVTTTIALSWATGLIRPSADAGDRSERQRRGHSGEPVVGEDVDQVGVVGDDRDGAAAGPLLGEQRDQLAPGGRVLAEGRLVEHQDPGRGGQRGGDRQPALLAAGERVRVGVGERGQAQPLEQLVGGGPRRRRVLAGAQRPQGELVAQPAGEELLLGMLEDRADPGDQLPGPPPVRLASARAGRRRPARRRPRPGRWWAPAARPAAGRAWTCPVPFGPGDGERPPGPQDARRCGGSAGSAAPAVGVAGGRGGEQDRSVRRGRQVAARRRGAPAASRGPCSTRPPGTTSTTRSTSGSHGPASWSTTSECGRCGRPSPGRRPSRTSAAPGGSS